MTIWFNSTNISLTKLFFHLQRSFNVNGIYIWKKVDGNFVKQKFLNETNIKLVHLFQLCLRRPEGIVWQFSLLSLLYYMLYKYSCMSRSIEHTLFLLCRNVILTKFIRNKETLFQTRNYYRLCSSLIPHSHTHFPHPLLNWCW